MNIGLIGYGRMGRMIEAAALDRGHRIVTVLDPSCRPGETYKPELADVLIEFTGPGAAPDNIRAAAAAGKAVVCGSTGWYDALPEVSAAVEAAGTALLWASNFSLGVNLFYRIAAYAAKLADPFDAYDVGGLEIHHNKKADSPSGTAKTLAERVLASMSRKKNVLWEAPQKPVEPGTIHFASLRAGAAPGRHSLFFDSPSDTIEITHSARNREGFAGGALVAAEWLVRSGPRQAAGEGRRGIFTMDDVLKDILAGTSENTV
ncbi:MAG: 4-hydroxy-tetrahydrodipicolinate reductase [Spirochaetaceae bacterium]|nr:4-hydroxy-tetrahydrodipicolinate reductase [Spirochaetaceae bacterium]